MITYLGGASEISDLYGGITLQVSSETRIAAGGYLALDRSNPSTTFDGFFAYLMTCFDVGALFGPQQRVSQEASAGRIGERFTTTHAPDPNHATQGDET